MKRHDQPILIASDNQAELDEIKLHLSSGFTRIYDVTDIEVALHLFESKRPALILLAFKSIKQAEKFYLKLFYRSEHIYEIPHQVIVFISRSELERAYELCRREIFHSFVIIRPMLSEYFLRIAVYQALEKRATQLAIQYGRKLLQRLAEQFESIQREMNSLLADNRTMNENQRNAQHALADSIQSRLTLFRDGLMGSDMQKVVTVHDVEGLKKEFRQLQEQDVAGQLEYYHGKMNEALGSWTGHLENHLSKLEQVSTEVSQDQQKRQLEILLIDDDEIQRVMLSALLEERGYSVREATNGNEGMSILQANVPDLVLLDYEMPELDGLGLLQKIRLSPMLKEVPIIMLTGHHEQEIVKRCLIHGANDYLVKPVEIQRLEERLHHYLPF